MNLSFANYKSIKYAKKSHQIFSTDSYTIATGSNASYISSLLTYLNKGGGGILSLPPSSNVIDLIALLLYLYIINLLNMLNWVYRFLYRNLWDPAFSSYSSCCSVLSCFTCIKRYQKPDTKRWTKFRRFSSKKIMQMSSISNASPSYQMSWLNNSWIVKS